MREWRREKAQISARQKVDRGRMAPVKKLEEQLKKMADDLFDEPPPHGAGLEFGHDIHQPKIMRPTRFGLQIQRRIGEILEEERKRAQPPGAAAASPAVVSKQVFDRVMEPVLFSCCADKRSSSTAKQFVDRQVLDAFAKQHEPAAPAAPDDTLFVSGEEAAQDAAQIEDSRRDAAEKEYALWLRKKEKQMREKRAAEKKELERACDEKQRKADESSRAFERWHTARKQGLYFSSLQNKIVEVPQEQPHDEQIKRQMQWSHGRSEIFE